MRKTLFATAALLGLAVSGPAFAHEASPDAYLRQALQDVQQHQQVPAVVAVNHAENAILLSGAAAQNRPPHRVGEPQVYRQMARAREAIQTGLWQEASDYLDAAMSHPSASVATSGASGP